MKTKNAFAFIELLVDLAFVAIILGLIIPYYKHMEKNISMRISRREIRMLKLAVTSYYENQNPKTYPAATENLCADYLLQAKPQIIKTILDDPFSRIKQEYRYTLSPNTKFYCIWSISANRRSDIQGVDDEGSVIKDKKCDDIYATLTIDPSLE
ncbi:MAG: hypothetical protein Q8O13_08120 [Candidatus Omnitrophota bacterium]|nr:hypothetical protein [Candidatus Omnitrophota bacterium]